MASVGNVVVILALLSTCAGYTSHVPSSVCERFTPSHRHAVSRVKARSQPLITSPYRIVLTNTTPGATMTVQILGSRTFKGFIIQARAEGSLRPVGTFEGKLEDHTQHLWCSGGEAKNSVCHNHTKGVTFDQLNFTWKAPDVSVGNITFWATIVDNFTIFWSHLSSRTLAGSPAANATAPRLEPSFKITKQGCGTDKSCYSEPSSCSSSETCEFLVTYKTQGDNVTFEMSGTHGYVAVGFNYKQEMDATDTISCSTSSNQVVEVRHYNLDYHQPIRSELRGSSDIIQHAGAYDNGTILCRFSRKITPRSPNMRDLTREWFFIFAWGRVYTLGGLRNHREGASFTPKPVNIFEPTLLENGRDTSTQSPGLKITKEKCGKTKGCTSEPADCMSSDDCNYLMTYEPKGDEVIFELSSKTAWASIGFNVEKKMDGTDALICVHSPSVDRVTLGRYAIKGYDSPKKTTPDPVELSFISGAYKDGSLQCRFSRKKKSSLMIDLEREVFVIFARGAVTDEGSIIKHTHKSITLAKVDLSKVEALETSDSKNIVLLRAHAILMVIAWLGFATVGMFMARYMRVVWGDLFGLKAWFQIHRALMFLTLIFTIVAFILVFVHVGKWSEGAKVHAAFGLVVTLCACLQPIGAFFRPNPGHENRLIFNWLHRSVGLFSLVLAVVNIFLGIRLPHLDIQETGIYPIVVYCVGLALVVVFELALILRKDSGGDVNVLVKGDVKKDTVDVMPTVGLGGDKKKRLRKLALALLVVLVSGAIVALIVLVVTAGHEHH